MKGISEKPEEMKGGKDSGIWHKQHFAVESVEGNLFICSFSGDEISKFSSTVHEYVGYPVAVSCPTYSKYTRKSGEECFDFVFGKDTSVVRIGGLSCPWPLRAQWLSDFNESCAMQERTSMNILGQVRGIEIEGNRKKAWIVDSWGLGISVVAWPPFSSFAALKNWAVIYVFSARMNKRYENLSISGGSVLCPAEESVTKFVNECLKDVLTFKKVRWF